MKSSTGNNRYTDFPILSLGTILIAAVLSFGASLSSPLSMLWGVTSFVYGMIDIIRNRDIRNNAIIWSAYIAGLEVVLRGTGGSIFWEFGKYSVIILLLTGLSYGNNKIYQVPNWIIFILILLIPGIITTFSWSNRIAQDISFNISGILCLLASSAYFFTKKVSYESFLKTCGYFILPVISLIVVIFIKSPNLNAIHFKASANFAASGGFGPNQVATILGMGWLLVLLTLILKEKLTCSKYITYTILMLILFRSFLTFSRGGNVAAVLALAAFIYTYLRYDKHSSIVHDSLKKLVIFIGAVMIIGSAVNEITGGMFGNRISGRDGLGQEKVDQFSGRGNLLEEEISLFEDDPMGVGVGGSAHFRLIKFGNPLASHNEFGRLISEHGVAGIIIILLLIVCPLKHYFKQNNVNTKALCALFLVISIMTAMHSALRLAMPAFFYGMSFLTVDYDPNTK